MTSPPDIAAIARKLTPPQIDAVHRDGIGDQTMATVRAMRRKGLMYHHIHSPNGRCGPMRLTPLGQQVRAYLLEQQG